MRAAAGSGRVRAARSTRGAASARPASQAQAQAAGHARTRNAHGSEVAEDYVEAIADLVEATGEARVVELARRLGVTHVTVTKTIARLARAGYVSSRPYQAIFLTPSGRELAARARHRHRVVVAFLRAIGVSEAVAHADAEGIEHHVSDETLAAFERVAGGTGRRAKRST